MQQTNNIRAAQPADDAKQKKVNWESPEFFNWFLDMERQRSERVEGTVCMLSVKLSQLLEQPGLIEQGDFIVLLNRVEQIIRGELRISDMFCNCAGHLKVLYLNASMDSANQASRRLREVVLNQLKSTPADKALVEQVPFRNYIWDYSKRNKFHIEVTQDSFSTTRRKFKGNKREKKSRYRKVIGLLNVKRYAGIMTSGRYKVKRLVDILGALGGLIVFAPLLIVISAAIKVTSPGPVLFVQKRVGLNGKLFDFYKFRSMRHNNDNKQHREFMAKLINGDVKKPQNGTVYKMADDPRITRIGRFLRRTSLDELPQLLNVIKGDMSLVGPRPAIPYEVENYKPWHLQRVQVMPGITGLWQVKGRSKTTFVEMCRLDIQYIRNWNLWLDSKLLVQTIGTVFKREGAV